MSSIEPDNGCGEIDGTEEGLRPFVVAGCDASELLEFGEEILDQVSGFIHFLIIGALLFPVFLGRNDALYACLLQQVKNPLLRVIGLVGQKRLNVFEKIRQQGIGSFQIMGLSRRQMKAGRVTQSIAGRVYLRRQSAFAAPDALFRFVPPFAPAAC